MTAPDWGAGAYEQIAPDVRPGAEHIIAAAHLRPNEQVLDLGCGTGNATMLAARAGGRVVAVDPTPRLLEVARAAASAAGLPVDFRIGGAPGIPVDDASHDVVLSNFAVIFTPDPAGAVEDMVRVLRPGGRIVFTAWVPGDTIDAMSSAGMRKIAAARGRPAERFAWHDEHEVTRLFAATGRLVSVRAEAHALAFTAASPDAYLDRYLHHPMWTVEWQSFVAAGGDPAPVRNAMRDVLIDGNEDPQAFKATSRFLVYTVHLAP